MGSVLDLEGCWSDDLLRTSGTKSEDATALIPSSPITDGQVIGACREAAVLPARSNLCLKIKSEKVLVPEPPSCLRGCVLCLFGTAHWAMYLVQHLDFRLFFSTWQMKGKIT